MPLPQPGKPEPFRSGKCEVPKAYGLRYCPVWFGGGC